MTRFLRAFQVRPRESREASASSHSTGARAYQRPSPDAGHATRTWSPSGQTPDLANVAPWLLPHKWSLGHHAETRIYAGGMETNAEEAITMLAMGMTSGADE